MAIYTIDPHNAITAHAQPPAEGVVGDRFGSHRDFG